MQVGEGSLFLEKTNADGHANIFLYSADCEMRFERKNSLYIKLFNEIAQLRMGRDQELFAI
jgi:hypothetical protein